MSCHRKSVCFNERCVNINPFCSEWISGLLMRFISARICDPVKASHHARRMNYSGNTSLQLFPFCPTSNAGRSNLSPVNTSVVVYTGPALTETPVCVWVSVCAITGQNSQAGIPWATSSWLPASGWAVQELQGLSEEHNDSVWHHTLWTGNTRDGQSWLAFHMQASCRRVRRTTHSGVGGQTGSAQIWSTIHQQLRVPDLPPDVSFTDWASCPQQVPLVMMRPVVSTAQSMTLIQPR